VYEWTEFVERNGIEVPEDVERFEVVE